MLRGWKLSTGPFVPPGLDCGRNVGLLWWLKRPVAGPFGAGINPLLDQSNLFVVQFSV